MDEDTLLENALLAVYSARTGQDIGLVTKYIVVAEVTDGDGDRILVVAHDDDSNVWDTLGLVKYADVVYTAEAKQTLTEQ